MQDYGTRIVAGVTPGKSGSEISGVPVYNTVEEAKDNHLSNATIILAPAQFTANAAHEALDAGIKTVVIVTEHVPLRDAIGIMAHAAKAKAAIIGPNTPGVITPGKCKLGIMPSNVFVPGNIGIVSRSGTLTYEIATSLTKKRLGQSTCLGIGGDMITGINFIEALELFKADEQTKAIVLIGEIGGNLEELTAGYIAETHYQKPIVAYIAGRSAPPEKRMGHAGAIIMGQTGTAKSKVEAFENVDVSVAEKPSDVAELLASAFGR